MPYDSGKQYQDASLAALRGVVDRSAPAPRAGIPPVSHARQEFQTTDRQEVEFMQAMARAKQRARIAAMGKKKQHTSASPQTVSSLPQYQPPPPPALPAIIDPYKGVIGGIGGQVQAGVSQATADQAHAQKALPKGSDAVAGATVGDVGSAVRGNISGTGSDLKNDLSSRAAQFILQQMQQRQQIQQSYLDKQGQNQLSPSELRQLIAAGIDPNSININDPYAVAAALGQSERKASTKYGLSLGTLSSLVAAGIDPAKYKNDPEGAAIALGKARQKKTPSLSDAKALMDAYKGLR